MERHTQLFLINEESEKRKIFIPSEAMSIVGNGGFAKKAVQGGNIITLDVDETAKLQIGRAFASVKQVTSCCYAIDRTCFNAITPKPDWYDGLNAKFKKVQNYAELWLNDYSVAVSSTIPSSIINYVPTFEVIMGKVRQIAAKYQNAENATITDGDRDAIDQLIGRLLDETKSTYEDVRSYAYREGKTVNGLLIDWKANINDAANDLHGGTATIQDAEDKLRGNIESLNDAINDMNAQIAKYDKDVLLGAGLVGVGATIGVVGGATCFCQPYIGGILIAVGVISVIGGAATWGVFQGKINDLNNKIEQCNREIAKDELTITALDGLNANMARVVDDADYASDNMADFVTSWVTFEKTLEKMRENVHKIGSDADQNWANFLVTDIDIAIEYWNNAKDYANELLECPTDVKEVQTSQVA